MSLWAIASIVGKYAAIRSIAGVLKRAEVLGQFQTNIRRYLHIISKQNLPSSLG